MKLHVRLRVSVTAAILCLPVTALCQSSTFELIVANKPVGKSVYTISKQKNSYKLVSRQTFRIGGREGDQTSEFKLGETYNYLDGTTTDHNTQMQTSYIPNKGGDSLSISHYQGGGHDSTPVPSGPNLIVLPPLDAGAAQIALRYILANPRPDNIYSLLVAGGSRRGGGGDGPPDQAAATAAASIPTGPGAFDVLYLKGKDTSGVLDGKPVVLHSYLLGVGRFKVAFYADDQNDLMEFYAPGFQATYLRSGFKLDSSAPSTPKPPTP